MAEMVAVYGMNVTAPVPAPPQAARTESEQYKAWGNAPGNVPTHAMRAVSAKEVQAERHELARTAEAQPAFYKRSRKRYHRG